MHVTTLWLGANYVVIFIFPREEFGRTHMRSAAKTSELISKTKTGMITSPCLKAVFVSLKAWTFLWNAPINMSRGPCIINYLFGYRTLFQTLSSFPRTPTAGYKINFVEIKSPGVNLRALICYNWWMKSYCFRPWPTKAWLGGTERLCEEPRAFLKIIFKKSTSLELFGNQKDFSRNWSRKTFFLIYTIRRF